MASAIVILTDLRSFTPVWNRMELCVNETDAPTKALTGFRYIFDVYIENVSTPTYKRFFADPSPTLGYGVVDISRYCQGAVNNTMSQYNSVVPFSLGANANGTQSIIKVTVKYGYQYYIGTTLTTVANTVTGSDKYAFNGAVSKQWFYNYLFATNDFASDYLCNITNGANGQFLTDMKTNYVSMANLGWHHILTDVPTDIDSLVVITYNSAGAVIQTVVKSISVSQALTSSRMYKVATGPQTLNNMTGAFVSGAQPIITSSVARYEVKLVNGAGTIASETLNFVMKEPCRYTQRRLHFLNRFGSFDSFNFDLRNQRKSEITRKTYKYNPYPIVNAGISRSFTEQNQVVNYGSVQETMILRSDFIDTDENTWLKQLVNSSEIYLEELDGTGTMNLTAIESCVGTSWLERETDIDKLFNMEVEIKFSTTDITQGR
jgi:hypothetical protein